MKRLLILLISLAIAVVACGQEVLKRDLEIRKTAPLLNLNGSGATLRFYNGDVSLTQSSNLLTLSGGNFSLGANSLLGSGSIGATGARLLKGWFTDFEITNLPTINGGTLASALSLSSYLLKTDTATMLSNYTRNGELNSALAAKISASDTAAMLARYALLSEIGSGGDVSAIETRIDSIVSILADTANIEQILQIDLDNDTVAAKSWVRDYVALHGGTSEAPSDSVGLADVAPLLTDTKPWFVFGAGIGEAADSVSFAKGKRSFGSFNVVQDSLYVVSLDNILISANDSLKFNVYYGNRMTATPVDSLFTGPQSCGDNQTTFTPNNERTIPPGNDVWVGLMADQPTGYRPKEWNLQLNGQIRRD